jgi:hypothetical protein
VPLLDGAPMTNAFPGRFGAKFTIGRGRPFDSIFKGSIGLKTLSRDNNVLTYMGGGPFPIGALH